MKHATCITMSYMLRKQSAFNVGYSKASSLNLAYMNTMLSTESEKKSSLTICVPVCPLLVMYPEK